MTNYGIVCISKENTVGLARTVNSILAQCYRDYFVVFVISNFTSADLSVISTLPDNKYCIIKDCDFSLYDAMNLGMFYLRSNVKYISFLNAGDEYASFDVLSTINDQILASSANPEYIFGATIISGNGPTYLSRSNRKFFPSTNVDYPIHQSCFFSSELLGGFCYPNFLHYSADLYLMEYAFVNSSVVLMLPQVIVSRFNREGGISSLPNGRKSRSLDAIRAALISIISFGISSRLVSLLFVSSVIAIHSSFCSIIKPMGNKL